MKSVCVLFPLCYFFLHSVQWSDWIGLDVRALNITAPKTVNQHLCNDSHSSLSSSMFLRHPLVCNTLYTVYLSSLSLIALPLIHLICIIIKYCFHPLSLLWFTGSNTTSLFLSLSIFHWADPILAITNTSPNSCFTVSTMFMNPFTLQENKLHLAFHYETKKCILIELENSE